MYGLCVHVLYGAQLQVLRVVNASTRQHSRVRHRLHMHILPSLLPSLTMHPTAFANDLLLVRPSLTYYIMFVCSHLSHPSGAHHACLYFRNHFDLALAHLACMFTFCMQCHNHQSVFSTPKLIVATHPAFAAVPKAHGGRGARHKARQAIILQVRLEPSECGPKLIVL